MMAYKVTDIGWDRLNRGWKPLPLFDDKSVGAASSREKSIMSSGFFSLFKKEKDVTNKYL